MADDQSLLLRIRGDAAGGKAAIAETRAAIASLRSTTATEFSAMQNAGSKAFASITDNLNVFVGQRIPLVGGAFVRVTENLRGLGTESGKVEQQTAKLASTIEGLAKETGKSSGQITSFLTSFVQLETQAKRDTAAIETFGAAAAQKLIPQLEKAGEELSTVAAAGESTASSMAGIAGPLGLAVLGILATVAAAGLLGKALFDVAERAADFQGKMFDLSQQTGVSVETLSALEIVAKTTGGSIESIAQSLVIFQGKLDEAQDSASKAGKTFTELGISTKNTEESFRDALASLAKMPEGFKQTNDAAELFGRRGGKQVLAILKETKGDLDGAIEKFRAMGILISTEDAKAADDFNDQLAILGFQLRSIVGTIGKEVVPTILKATQDLSKAFNENKDAIQALGVAASAVAGLFTNPLRGAIEVVTVAWRDVQPVLEKVAEVYERIAKASERLSGGLPPLALLNASGGFGIPQIGEATGGGEAGFSVFDAHQPAREAAKKAKQGADPAVAAVRLAALRLQATLEGLSEEDRITKHSLDQRKMMFEQYADITTHSENQRHLLTVAGLTDEAKAAETIRDSLQKQIKLKEIDNKLSEENNRHAKAKQDLDDEQAKIDKEIVETVAKLNKSTAEYVVTVDKYQQAVDDLVESLANQGVTLKPLILDTLRFDAAMAGARDRTLEALKALEDLSNAPRPPEVAGVDEKGAAKDAGAAADKAAGLPPVLRDTTSAIEQLFRAINENLTGDKQTGALAGLQTMVEVFGQLGQAVGQVVQSFVLYGSAGTSVRKVTAQILASIAQQAAVKAVFELAEGFAALALAFFGLPNAGPSANAHFIAAATYGAIAGVAAIAGRVAAGNSFNQQGASSTGGGSTSGGVATKGGSPAPRDINRTDGNLQAQTIVHELVFKVKGDAVIDEFVKDFDLNGRTRITFRNAG